MSLVHKLIRKLYPHGEVRTVLRGPVRGMRFVVVPGMGATYALAADTLNWHFLRKRVHEGDVVYDVGANCGQMALFFSCWVGAGGGVYSFEPAPENVKTLRRNLAMNSCSNVEVIEAAVAADSQPRRFCFDAAHHTMGTLEGAMVKQDAWQTTLEVSCVTLDDMLVKGSRPPDVIKIDVEGAGLGVIEGANRLIEAHRPAIYFELHAADEDAPELQAVRMLRDCWGYRLLDLNGSVVENPGPMWGAALWCEPPEPQ